MLIYIEDCFLLAGFFVVIKIITSFLMLNCPIKKKISKAYKNMINGSNRVL